MSPIIARKVAPGPVASAPAARSTCSGWSCLSDAEQFGVLFSIIVTITILGVIYLCYLKSRSAERDVDVELVQVRLPRELRRRYASPVPVMLPPPPAYQAVQVQYGQYSQPGMHIQAPPGATVQPYTAGPVGSAPVTYGQLNNHQPPPGFNGPVQNPYYAPQQPFSQVPAGCAPFHGPQPRAYGQDPGTGPWHTPNTRHMSAVPQSAEPHTPTLKQRLMRMFRLPIGHASTVTESLISPTNAVRAASPRLASASRHSSPVRPLTRRSTRGARGVYRRPARTVSPRPRRSMHSYRYASPKPRPRSQSPYRHRNKARYRFSRDRSSSSSSTSTSSCGSGSSTGAVVRGRSRGSDRT